MKQTKQIIINNKSYNFNIHLERRNSSRVSISKTGVNIRIPRQLSRIKQEKQIQELIDWAIKKIEKSPPKEEINKIYSDLDIITIYDKEYKILIENRISTKNFTKLNDNKIQFKIANHHSNQKKQEYIKKQLKKIIETSHTEEITERVHKINKLCFNEPIKKVKIKYLKSQWGHCTSKNEICLSTRLLLAPKAVLNYVIVHELAHLKEMNHSKKFWKIVKTVDKTYKIKEKWLNDYGHTLVI